MFYVIYFQSAFIYLIFTRANHLKHLCIVISEDEMDSWIRELFSELQCANQRLAACREQLQTFMTYIEEYTQTFLL